MIEDWYDLSLTSYFGGGVLLARVRTSIAQQGVIHPSVCDGSAHVPVFHSMKVNC